MGHLCPLKVPPDNQPKERHVITQAFTAENLGLSQHTYPLKQLQVQYHHLKGIPLQPIDHACPLSLAQMTIKYAYLITATEDIQMGPPGSPLALHTMLG